MLHWRSRSAQNFFYNDSIKFNTDCSHCTQKYNVLLVLLFRGRDGSIVFGIVAKFFFSVNMITHKPLHLAWWNFAWICTLTTSRSLLNIKVKGQVHKSFFVCTILFEPVGLDSRMLHRRGPRAALSLQARVTYLFSLKLNCQIICVKS